MSSHYATLTEPASSVSHHFLCSSFTDALTACPSRMTLASEAITAHCLTKQC